MATPRIKATYSLDVETVRALERTAKRWNVSKSEALRRAIVAAAERAETSQDDPLAALESLQDSASLTVETASTWEARVRRERRASSSSRMPTAS